MINSLFIATGGFSCKLWRKILFWKFQEKIQSQSERKKEPKGDFCLRGRDPCRRRRRRRRRRSRCRPLQLYKKYQLEKENKYHLLASFFTLVRESIL